jgi:hypothetical protein
MKKENGKKIDKKRIIFHIKKIIFATYSKNYLKISQHIKVFYKHIPLFP